MLLLLSRAILAADSGQLPYVGGVFGIGGAMTAVWYIIRFQRGYVKDLEKDRISIKQDLKDCREDGERKDWQLGFLVNVLRANGIVIPARFWAANWREQPREITGDDLTHPDS